MDYCFNFVWAETPVAVVLRQAARLGAFLYLSSSFTKHSVDEGHYGRLQADFISVASSRSVQVRQERLKQITRYNLWERIQEPYRPPQITTV